MKSIYSVLDNLDFISQLWIDFHYLFQYSINVLLSVVKHRLVNKSALISF